MACRIVSLVYFGTVLASTEGAGLFPPVLSDLQFGTPAWGTPTSRWSSSCPYGTIDGVTSGSPTTYTAWQTLLSELDLLRQRHLVVQGDTWQTIANTYHGSTNQNGLEQVLRYNGLDLSIVDNVPPIVGTYVIVEGTGMSSVLPECKCPVGYYDETDDLYCRNDDPNSVFLNPRPRRIYVAGQDGTTQNAHPAGYTTSGSFELVTGGVEITFWEIDTLNLSATANATGASSPAAELYIDLGAISEVRDINVVILRGTTIPEAFVFGSRNTTTNQFEDHFIAIDCNNIQLYQTIANGSYANLTPLCIGSSTIARFFSIGIGGTTDPDITDQVRITVISEHCSDNCENLKIDEVRITGRRSCNGHASSVFAMTDNSEPVCQCEHNTIGDTCNECLPLYNNVQYQEGNGTHDNACEACNCNNHVVQDGSCHFDATKGHGVCDNCIHNTVGDFCERCLPSFQRNQNSTINSSDTCIPCACNEAGGTDGAFTECIQEQNGFHLGQCQCKANVQGLKCDECIIGFHSLEASNVQGCTECSCSLLGSLIPEGEVFPDACSAEDGQCACKSNVTGRDCDTCLSGHHRLSASNPNGCELCLLGNLTPSGDQLFMYSDPSTNECTDCDAECIECYGTGPDHCTTCRNFNNSGVCVDSCPTNTYANLTSRTCIACHPNCRTGSQCLTNDRSTCSCSGPSQDECTECTARIVPYSSNIPLTPPLTIDANRCLAEGENCPPSHYSDSTRECQECNTNCDLTMGCAGPSNTQCGRCALFDNNGACEQSCPGQTWIDPVTSVPGVQMCTRCSSECATGYCSAPNATLQQLELLSSSERVSLTASSCAITGPNGCQSFYVNAVIQPFPHSNITVPSACVSECPINTWTNYSARICEECHPECAIGCTGSDNTNCARDPRTQLPMCSNYLIAGTSTCVATCPPDNIASEGGWRVDGTTCVPCNSECDSNSFNGGDNCYGPSASQCVRCATLEQPRDSGPLCVSACDAGYGPSFWGRIEAPLPCANIVDGLGTSQCLEEIEAANMTILEACAEIPEPDGSGVDFSVFCERTCCETSAITQPTTTTVDTTTTALSPGGRLPSPATCGLCPFTLAGSELCIESCSHGSPSTGWLYLITGTSTCGQCSSQCRTGCSGPTAAECTGETPCIGASRVQNGQRICVPSCVPTGEYATGADQGLICATCPSQCNALQGNHCCTSNGNPSESATCGYRESVNCLACDSTCASCNGPTSANCTTCVSVRGPNGQCMDSCPEGYFAGTNQAYPDDRVCQLCSTTCASSSGCSGPHPSQCNECRVARAPDLSCVDSCSNGMVFVPPLSANNTEFVDGLLPLTYVECRDCENALHYENDTGSCVPCNDQCFSGCNGPTASNCIAVTSSRVCNNAALTNDTGTHCVDVCPTEYADVAQADGSRVCEACSSQCLSGTSCSGPEPADCSICTAYRLIDETGPCVTDCTEEGPYYNPTGDDAIETHRICRRCDVSCLQCTGSQPIDCPMDQCAENYSWDANLGCQQFCPLGKYEARGGDDTNPFRFCADCHHSCNPALGCRGPDSNQCQGCRNNRLNTQIGTVCVDTCPGGTYSLFGECVSCNAACSDLATCTDRTETTCSNPEWIPTISDPAQARSVILNLNVSATTGLFGSALQEAASTVQSAFAACGLSFDGIKSIEYADFGAIVSLYRRMANPTSIPTYVQQLETNILQDFFSLRCLDDAFVQSSIQSVTRIGPVELQPFVIPCADGYVLDGTTCVLGCDEGYPDSRRVCSPCDAACATCSGPGSAGCITCAVAANSEGTCVSSCGSNQYITIGPTPICSNCDAECDGCTGGGSTNCVSCRNYEFGDTCVSDCPGRLNGNSCVESCPTGAQAKYADENNECQPCDSECASCTGPNLDDCLSCNALRGIDGLCTSSCPDNTYVANASCFRCHPQCQGSCSGPAATQCNFVGNQRCKNAIVGNECVEKCVVGSYFNSTVDSSGGKICQTCHRGFRCPDGINEELCEGKTMTCRPGSTQCYTCPSATEGSCQFNSETSVFDDIVCEIGYDLDLATCSCEGDSNIPDVIVQPVGASEENTVGSSTLLIAVAVGGLALLLFVGAIVYLMRDPKEDTVIANETLASIQSMSTLQRGMKSYPSGGISIANSAYTGGYGAGGYDAPETAI